MLALWWLVAAIVFLVIEMITPGLFFFACLAVGALVAALVAWMGAGTVWAWISFLLSSTLLILIVAPIVRRWAKSQPTEPVGLDALVGQRARVIDAVDPTTGAGQVRLESGSRWRALADEPLPMESWVEIVEVVGTRLRVRAIKE